MRSVLSGGSVASRHAASLCPASLPPCCFFTRCRFFSRSLACLFCSRPLHCHSHRIMISFKRIFDNKCVFGIRGRLENARGDQNAADAANNELANGTSTSNSRSSLQLQLRMLLLLLLAASGSRILAELLAALPLSAAAALAVAVVVILHRCPGACACGLGLSEE